MIRSVKAAAYEMAEPPREIRLWRAGENPTDYGVHLWTERSAQLVWERYTQRGNPLEIDIEHGMAKETDPANPPPCAGLAHLSIRAGEPWLTFEWSAIGAEQIATRQRRFLSPEYGVHPDTGEILELVRVSLVAAPGTHNAPILATRKATNMDPMAVLKALQEALAGEGSPEEKMEKLGALLQAFEVAAGAAAGAEPEAPGEEPGGEITTEAATPEEANASADLAEEEQPVAARRAATAPRSAASTAAAVAEVRSAIEAGKRDLLLASRRAEAVPAAVRAAMATMPVASIEKILAAYPQPSAQRNDRPVTGGESAPKTAAERIAAARPGSQLHAMALQAGIVTTGAQRPHRNQRGEFVVQMMTPTQVRALRAKENG